MTEFFENTVRDTKAPHLSSFLKMLINSMIDFLKELGSKASQNGKYRAQG